MMKKFILFCVVLILLNVALPLKAQTPTGVYIFAKTLTLAATEYKVIISPGVKAISVQCRGGYDLRIAFKEGGTTLDYRTIKYLITPVYYSPPVKWNGVFYLRCEQAGQIAEIEYWK